MKAGGQDAGRGFVQDEAVRIACQTSGSAIPRAFAVVAAAMVGLATSGCLVDGYDAASEFVEGEAVGVGVHDIAFHQASGKARGLV